jgi:hypothetical protein
MKTQLEKLERKRDFLLNEIKKFQKANNVNKKPLSNIGETLKEVGAINKEIEALKSK